MPIQFSCSGCGSGFSVSDGDAGRLCKCEKCDTMMRVPTRNLMNHFDTGEPVGTVSEPDTAFAAPARGPVAPPANDPHLRPKLDPGFDAHRSRGVWGYLRARLCVLFVIMGALAMGRGYQEMQLSRNSAPQPQRITCDQLAKHGPGDNAHVLLSDFRVGSNYCANVPGQGSAAQWTTVWLPLTARTANVKPAQVKLAGQVTTTDGPARITAAELQILVKSSRHNEAELTPLYAHKEIEGTVVKCIDSLGPAEMKLLQAAYPGADFAQRWMLEEGRKPLPPTRYVSLFAGGGALFLLAALAAMTGGGRR